MGRWVVLILCMLAFWGCGGGSSPPPTPLNAILVPYWNHQQTVVAGAAGGVFPKPESGFDPRTYPSESAISFLSAWQMTGSDEFLQSAKRQLALAVSLQNADHYLPFHGSEPVIAKVSQARLIWGFWMAFRATGDPSYLNEADKCAQAMLGLKRDDTVFNGATHRVFHYTYSASPPYAPIESALIDPNQEAMIGLVYALLYKEPTSALHNRADIRQLAVNMIDAALALQTSDGRMGLAQIRPDEYDSLYGSFALMSVFWANQILDEPRFEEALQRSVVWLGSLTTAGITDRYYPQRYSGRVPDPAELYFRLPILHHYRMHEARLRSLLIDRLTDWNDYKSYAGGWSAPTAPMQWMGVPARYFTE